MKYIVDSSLPEEFINHQEVLDTIEEGKKKAQDKEYLQDLLKKAKSLKGLNHREAYTLLMNNDEEITEAIYKLAGEIGRKIYGNRVVLFAPLYLSNYCVNGCIYCPYHGENKTIDRKILSMDEIREEVIALQDMGHKRLVLESGEHEKMTPIDYYLDAIKTVYSVHHKKGDTRRVNINIAATSVENFRKLREAEIGTYILFQETYFKEGYEKLHRYGPKADYEYHTTAMDRAMEAGIDDVGIGALFGLENYQYDFIGLLMHAEHLEARFGVGPHTISVPRVRPADHVDPEDFDNSLSDETFLKIIALIRLSAPYTGIIMSTREDLATRTKALSVGVSQISGGSLTSVGGYAEQQKKGNTSQFDTVDRRTLDDVVNWLLDLGKIPSFCTACYSSGRTGDRFMSLAKTGEISNICHPNALMTLKEYLLDYASVDTVEKGNIVIARELDYIKNPKAREYAENSIEKIIAGERDFSL